MARADSNRGVLQVQVESPQLPGHQQALVDHGAVREGWYVAVQLLAGEVGLGLLAHQVQGPLVGLGVQGHRRHDQHLLDTGHGGAGLVAQHGGVHGHLPPGQDAQAPGAGTGLQRLPRPGSLPLWLGQEDHSHRQLLGPIQAQAHALQLAGEEAPGQLDEDAGPVARLGVGVQGAAVGELHHGLQGHLHDVAARLGRRAGDEAHAAGVLLEGRVVEALGPPQRRHPSPSASRDS